MKKKRVICIIQARMSSTRLPGKSLIKINGTPCIEMVINRVSKSRLIHELWLACSDHSSDDILAKYLKAFKINTFRGNLNNVLSRFVLISKKQSADYIVRITGDCPLIDHNLIDKSIKKILEKKLDYVSNTIIRTYPDGIDVEVFKSSALYEAEKKANAFTREHVTPYISGKLKKYMSSGNFKTAQIKNLKDLSLFRLTLDREEDLNLLNEVCKKLGNNCEWQQAVNLIQKNSDLFKINNHIAYNENSKKDLNKLINDE
tara:strand:+ start:5053 stop:5829 length:777 start_codon:yes stop_codon:yes gene_type:complete